MPSVGHMMWKGMECPIAMGQFISHFGLASFIMLSVNSLVRRLIVSWTRLSMLYAGSGWCWAGDHPLHLGKVSEAGPAM